MSEYLPKKPGLMELGAGQVFFFLLLLRSDARTDLRSACCHPHFFWRSPKTDRPNKRVIRKNGYTPNAVVELLQLRQYFLSRPRRTCAV